MKSYQVYIWITVFVLELLLFSIEWKVYIFQNKIVHIIYRSTYIQLKQKQKIGLVTVLIVLDLFSCFLFSVFVSVCVYVFSLNLLYSNAIHIVKFFSFHTLFPILFLFYFLHMSKIVNYTRIDLVVLFFFFTEMISYIKCLLRI